MRIALRQPPVGIPQKRHALSECELAVCQDRASLVRSSPEGRVGAALQIFVIAGARPVTLEIVVILPQDIFGLAQKRYARSQRGLTMRRAPATAGGRPMAAPTGAGF